MTIPSDSRAGRIYVLRDPRDSQVKYVGKTVWTAERRLGGHVYHAKTRGKSHCSRWILGLLALDLYPVIEVVEEVPAGSGLLSSAECRWIAHYREIGASLCNQTDGGDGGSTWVGRKHSTEAKAKVSAANRKEANPERARKISESKKRQWQDPEYRAKMIEAGKRGSAIAAEKARGKPGRKLDDATKLKISQSLRMRNG